MSLRLPFTLVFFQNLNPAVKLPGNTDAFAPRRTARPEDANGRNLPPGAPSAWKISSRQA